MCILYIYLISFILIGFLTWGLSFSSLSRHELIQTFFYSFSAGGIGAVIFSIRMLYYHSHLDKNNCFFLFCWDDIPGSDNEKLIDFLKQKYNIDGLEKSKIEKINDQTIKVPGEKNNVLLTLNSENNKINLQIDEVRIDEFIASTTNGKLNIYNITNFNKNEDKNKFEFEWEWGWFWFYFNRPIMGAFVGFVTYVLIAGGLFNENNLSINNNQPIILAIGLGWLAGYNVTDLISRLESVASAIFGLEKEGTSFTRLKNLVHPKNSEKSGHAKNG